MVKTQRLDKFIDIIDLDGERKPTFEDGEILHSPYLVDEIYRKLPEPGLEHIENRIGTVLYPTFHPPAVRDR
jgi:hypothetical protein